MRSGLSSFRIDLRQHEGLRPRIHPPGFAEPAEIPEVVVRAEKLREPLEGVLSLDAFAARADRVEVLSADHPPCDLAPRDRRAEVADQLLLLRVPAENPCANLAIQF